MILHKLNMAQKRACEDQLPNEVSSKHPRQMRESNLNMSHVDMFSCKEVSGKHYLSGEGSFMVNDLEAHDICANDNEADNDAGVPRSLSLSPWAASSTSEEDYTLDLVAPLPFTTTEYFSFDRAVTCPLRADDLYSRMENPPRKSVPVGPDHQADIPLLSKSSFLNDEQAGNSVVPRNDLELPPVGSGRSDCECADMGSVRCVRQHIMDAREKLITSLGQEAFLELGFCGMGEVVSGKWSKDEQHLFHKVVHCNPVSLGKNFWNILSAVFPSRTKMEIVSYYFNVFMLQKRAEQNRHDPMNIDSDNDEWQLSEEEDEEDPVIDGDEDTNSMSNKLGCDELMEKRRNNDDVMENNVHEGSSYTSSDSGAPPGGGRMWQDFILEPCDAKIWDGYAICPKDEVDFLPTCSMIQEVFGDGTLDSDPLNTR